MHWIVNHPFSWTFSISVSKPLQMAPDMLISYCEFYFARDVSREGFSSQCLVHNGAKVCDSVLLHTVILQYHLLLYKNAKVKLFWIIIITVNNLLFCQPEKTLVWSWTVAHLVKWMTNQIIGYHPVTYILKDTAFRIHSKFHLFF